MIHYSATWRDGFAALGSAFCTQTDATPIPQAHWLAQNHPLAQELGLDAAWFASEAALAVFAGNARWDDRPTLATVYSGHQFGHWAGQLGDGRALLLGTLNTQGGPFEIQLKGAGRTPYSRGGDGRAVLRSSIREYLCSEAMHGLGVPTTRALCLVGSPALVQREALETAAVVTRIAPSFIRFGHFEHFSAQQRTGELRQLADFVVAQFYPECASGDGFAGNAYAALLQAVAVRTANLVAQWQGVGFCHGVMNTDNMSILGLTLDYGPFQFLDAYNPQHICNHSDTLGRYAYDQQPQVAYWNLFCLGQALLPLIEDQDLALAALHAYQAAYAQAWLSNYAAKLGFARADTALKPLIDALLALMANQGVDYTIFWRSLSEDMQRMSADGPENHNGHGTASIASGSSATTSAKLFADSPAFHAWMLQYLELTNHTQYGFDADLMPQKNPCYVLRNHLAQNAIQAAQQQDFTEIQRLNTLLARPCENQPGSEAYAQHPPPWASHLEISCSS